MMNGEELFHLDSREHSVSVFVDQPEEEFRLDFHV